jgi:hypothetical protein
MFFFDVHSTVSVRDSYAASEPVAAVPVAA